MKSSARDHTRLMNMFIGLCNNDSGWPTTLYDMGYSVLLLEEKISVGSSGAITPDLVAYSDRHSHAIVAECKSGHAIPSHQDALYVALSPSDLRPWIVTAGPKAPGHTACYVVNSHNHNALAGQTSLPFIVFGDFVRGHGKFGYAPLDKAMRAGAPLKDMQEPVGYYPFSDGDKISVIVPHILHGIITLARRPADRPSFDLMHPDAANRILGAVHPYYSTLGKKHKTALARKTRKIVKDLRKENLELDDQAKKVQDGGASTLALKKLASICQKIADGYAATPRIDDEY